MGSVELQGKEVAIQWTKTRSTIEQDQEMPNLIVCEENQVCWLGRRKWAAPTKRNS